MQATQVELPQPGDDLYPGFRPEFAMKKEPSYFKGEEFDALLVHAAELDASDVTVQTNEAAIAHIHGENIRLTKRTFTEPEVAHITNYIYGEQNGVTQIRRGEDIDTRHPVVVRGTNNYGSKVVQGRYGFRVNMTGCWARGNEYGIQITARFIKSLPPKLSDLGIEAGIVDNLYPENGLVLVCGPTGSGKSTLLAAGMREIIEKPDSNRKIITGEAPIEYVYDEIPRSSAIVSQHEIPRHLPSFERFVRNTLRRAPKIILVGETRDALTVAATLQASETGHAVYSTVHSNSVSSTLSRLVNMFEPSERMTKLFELVESFRLIVVQKLVRRVDGKGRVAMREFLAFDQTIRDHLRRAGSLREAEHVLNTMVERYGQTMLSSAQKAFDAGLIPAHELQLLERETQSRLIEEIGEAG